MDPTDWGLDIPAAHFSGVRGDRFERVDSDDPWDVPLVRTAGQHGYEPAPEAPMWAFLPAVWPASARAWVSDTRIRHARHACNGGPMQVVPWSTYLIRPGGAGAFANLMGRFAKDLMVEQIDREYAEVVPDQRIVSKATMTRRYAGRTTRTVNGTAITWLFEPRDGGTRETVGFHEGDLTWWQTLLDRIGAMILSRNVHGMLAAIREGVERRTRTAT